MPWLLQSRPGPVASKGSRFSIGWMPSSSNSIVTRPRCEGVIKWAASFPVKIAPSHWGCGPPSNTCFLWHIQVHNPNSISISSAIFAGPMIMTDRQSDHATPYVTLAVKSKVTGYSSCQHASPLLELTCHMGSHSVTCHPAEVTFQPLPQPKLVLDLATRRDARLS